MTAYPWHQAQLDSLTSGQFQSILLVSAPGQGSDRFARHLIQYLMCATQSACERAKVAGGWHSTMNWKQVNRTIQMSLSCNLRARLGRIKLLRVDQSLSRWLRPRIKADAGSFTCPRPSD